MVLNLRSFTIHDCELLKWRYLTPLIENILLAISVIELLKDFMQSGPYSTTREAWRVGIHMTFVVSGVLFAIMDNLADRRKSDHK